MMKHKLFQLLGTFTDDEIRKFLKFLKSPYFNSNLTILSLFRILMNYFPLFNHRDLTREKLFKKIYPDRTYHYSTINNLINSLIGLAKTFLIHEGLSKNVFDSYGYLLKELESRDNKELYKNNIKKLGYELEHYGKIDSDYFLYKYRVEASKFNFNVVYEKIRSKNKVLKHIEMINDSELALVIYFIIEMICDYVNLFIYSINYNVKIDSNLSKPLLQQFKLEKIYKLAKGRNEHDFILEIYFALLNAYSDFDNEAGYFDYKRLIEDHSLKLGTDELSFHYSNLINYWILKKKNEKPVLNIDPELLKIYEIVLEKEYYKNKKISHLENSLFRDILFLALRLNKFEWALHFVEKYSKKVHVNDRENMLNFGFAFYYHATGNYDKSMEYINKIVINYFIYKFDIYNLKLKNYYELGYIEESLSLIHAYRQFIRTNNLLSANRKKRHKHFAKFLEKLLKHKTGGKRIDLKNIRTGLLNEDVISNKAWLLEKIDSMCDSHK